MSGTVNETSVVSEGQKSGKFSSLNQLIGEAV